MTFNNIPVNGWPQIKGIENLDRIPGAIADISALETVVGDSDSGLVKRVNDQGTSITSLNTKIDNRVKYAATETVCGEWLGETLYRKVLDIGSLPNTDQSTQSTGLGANVTIRNYYGFADNGSYRIPLNYGTNVKTFVLSNGASYVITTTDDRSAYQGYLVLEYTKNPAPETREEDQEPADDTKIATIKRSKKS